MNRKLTLVAAATALVAGVSTANAGDVYVLGPEQMDAVTAGQTIRDLGFTRVFSRIGNVIPRSNSIEPMTVILETPAGGTLTSSFSLTSVTARAFSSGIQRVGSFQTTVSFDRE
jgi:hypothetical protein